MIAEVKKVTYPGVRRDRYLVANIGIIIDTVSGKIVRMDIDQDGYLRCDLLVDIPGFNKPAKHFGVHRIVAWEFCEGRDMNLVIDHIDGNKKFNWSSNLRWVTSGENTRAAEAMGLRNVRGEGNGTNKYPEAFIRWICMEYQNGAYPIDVFHKIYGSIPIPQNDPFYTLLWRLKRKEIWPGVVCDYTYDTDTFGSAPKIFLPGKAGKYSESTIRKICNLLSSGKTIYSVVDAIRSEPDCTTQTDKQLYDLVSSIRSRRTWTIISNDYTFPAGGENRISQRDFQSLVDSYDDGFRSYKEIADIISSQCGRNKKVMRTRVKKYLDLKHIPDEGVSIDLS